MAQVNQAELAVQVENNKLMLIYEVLLVEEAHPGREEQVKAIKTKLCGGEKNCPAAYRIAWASYNKSKKKKS